MSEKQSQPLLGYIIAFAIGAAIMFLISPAIPPEFHSSDYNRGAKAGRDMSLTEQARMFSAGYASCCREHDLPIPPDNNSPTP